MKSEELQKLSEEGLKRNLDKVCKTFKEADRILKKMAELGFYNASIICEAHALRAFEQEAMSRGLQVYVYVNEDNNGQLDLSWS